MAAQLAGCATAGGPFRCPNAGGPPWRELASDHFALRTDLDRGGAVDLLEQLELLRAAVKEALFGGAADPPDRVEVVAFRTAEEYEPFAPEGAQAYYLKYEGGPPRIVLSAEWTPRQRAIVAHELTHHLASSILLRQPRWLSEGLAAFMESLGEQRLERTLVVGVPPRGRLATARERLVEMRDLLRWESGGPTSPGAEYYAAAWLLVHYLVHQRPAAFAALLDRLSRGEALRAAWNAALPEYDLDRPLASLDHALSLWLQVTMADPPIAGLEPRYSLRGRPLALRTIHVAAQVHPSEQAIPPVEVHALRIALSAYGPGTTAALRAEVAEALREDPAHPIALAAHARIEGVEPLPLARSSVRAHPDDPRAWTFLAQSLKGSGVAAERESAYRRALGLAPDNAAALHNLGAELLEQGRSGEALPLVRRAARLAPWSAVVLDRYAAALADLGRCHDAARAQRQALDVLREPAAVRVRDEMQARLAEYQRLCGATEAAAPRNAQ
jgi:tetratricopeptide (TPR) repeat protein